MAAGKWTVEISPYGPQDPATDRSPRVFASDTISVAFDDDEPRRLERWERVGSRLRAVDGVEMVRRMRRARTFALAGQSYAADVALSYAFRLGNVEQVAGSAVFRVCG